MHPGPPKCAHCGSNAIIPNADFNLTSAVITVDTGARGAPGSWWDNKPVSERFDQCKCDVCCNCGAITMKIPDPQRLWTAYHQAGGRSA
jgi:hypothetical protein